MRFDYLILACGVRHSYFGHGAREEHASGLKTLEQGEMRRCLLHAFEMTENELDPARVRAMLTFVVVGGGPTRVELAGTIADGVEAGRERIAARTVFLGCRRAGAARARSLGVEHDRTAGSTCCRTY